MADDPDRQLDLLSMAGVPATAPQKSEPLAVRWAGVEAPGRLGQAAWPGGGLGLAEDLAHLRDHHRVGVLLALAEDATELLETARAQGVDLRQLSPAERGETLARHAEGLAADLRAGRRAVVVGADASAAALVVSCGLVTFGRSVEEALAAAGGPRALDGAALRAFAAASGEPAIERHEETSRAIEVPAIEVPAIEVPVIEVPAIEMPAIEMMEPRAEPRAEVIEDAAATRALVELGPIARSPRSARLAGAVLGAAIGDAMGHPTEFIRSTDEIRERFGPEGVTGYELWRDEGRRRVAPYTDDTQMAECVLRSLLAGREHGWDLDATMRELAGRFVAWAREPEGGHRAPGNACLAGCRNLEQGVPWHEAGGATAGGCGSVMRAYPFGLLFAHDLERAEAWSVAHSKLTHRDPIALAASAAMAVGVARVMRDEPVITVLSEMVAAACRYSPRTAGMMARAIDEAWSGVGPETTLERLEGWAAHEAIAAAVYLFARHPDDPRAAILEGANTPGDSDSLATLAGALVGARTGIGALPEEWVRDLERAGDLLALALAI